MSKLDWCAFYRTGKGSNGKDFFFFSWHTGQEDPSSWNVTVCTYIRPWPTSLDVCSMNWSYVLCRLRASWKNAHPVLHIPRRPPHGSMKPKFPVEEGENGCNYEWNIVRFRPCWFLQTLRSKASGATCQHIVVISSRHIVITWCFKKREWYAEVDKTWKILVIIRTYGMVFEWVLNGNETERELTFSISA